MLLISGRGVVVGGGPLELAVICGTEYRGVGGRTLEISITVRNTAVELGHHTYNIVKVKFWGGIVH